MQEVKASKYKLKTTAKFEAALVAALNICRELYNAALRATRSRETRIFRGIRGVGQ
jgi:hypothetical protein